MRGARSSHTVALNGVVTHLHAVSWIIAPIWGVVWHCMSKCGKNQTSSTYLTSYLNIIHTQQNSVWFHE